MSEKTKKIYQKPEITQVKLEPKEAVLLACKSWTVAASSAASKKTCQENPCNSDDGT